MRRQPLEADLGEWPGRGGEKQRTAVARAPPMLHEPAIDRPVAQLVGGVGLVQMPVVSKLMPPIAAAQPDVGVAKLLGHAQSAVIILAAACAELSNQRPSRSTKGLVVIRWVFECHARW